MHSTIRITEIYVGLEKPQRAGRNVVWYNTSMTPPTINIKRRGTWIIVGASGQSAND